jgi:hypothetical protein
LIHCYIHQSLPNDPFQWPYGGIPFIIIPLNPMLLKFVSLWYRTFHYIWLTVVSLDLDIVIDDNFLILNKMSGPAEMAISKGFESDGQPFVGLVTPLPNSSSASFKSATLPREP